MTWNSEHDAVVALAFAREDAPMALEKWAHEKRLAQEHRAADFLEQVAARLRRETEEAVAYHAPGASA